MENLTVSDVLERIKERHHLDSDYKVCKMLDLSTALVSGWRSGRTLPNERMCQRLGESAGIDPDVLIAHMNAQRSKDAGARAIWERIAERLSLAAQGVAVSLVFAFTATGFIANDADAASPSALHAVTSLAQENVTVCILC